MLENGAILPQSEMLLSPLASSPSIWFINFTTPFHFICHHQAFFPLMTETLCLAYQSFPTLRDPMDCSPPGSSVHGILQARILEWFSMPSSRGSSHCRLILYLLSHRGSPDDRDQGLLTAHILTPTYSCSKLALYHKLLLDNLVT